MNDVHSDAALRVIDAVKHYGSNRALDGVDLHVMPGEFVALLGPNGAGKTTLFQLLSGLFSASTGRIFVQGVDLRSDPLPALAALGIVFQQATLDLDLSVVANLRFHARLHGIAAQRCEARIAQLLPQLGLADARNARCRTLSGGNRRRVELARALLHEPSVLLMDEPTVGLDPESRQAILQHIHALCRERGLAVLWATHLVDEAAGADRVYILHRGRVCREGPPQRIVADLRADSLLDAFLQLTGEERPAA